MSKAHPHPGQPTEITRATADGLRKKGQYAAAAEAYAAIWPDKDPWTGWAYALCLRKLKKADAAVSIARAVVDLAPDFEFGRSVLAWALFDTIRAATEISTEILSRAELVIELCGKGTASYERTSPFVATILLVARLLSRKGRHDQALKWLQLLDPARLGPDEFVLVDSTGKQRKLASQRERYHGIRTFALEKLGRWEECLAAAEAALTACTRLHHDNDIWFARRVARAKINLGRWAEGIGELEKLAARKPTSFIHFDIAEAAWKANELDRAFQNCLLALQSPGDLAYKLAPLLLMARLLWDRGKEEEARRHLTLYIAYRSGKRWRVSSEVMTMAAEWNANIASASVADLLRQAKVDWRQLAEPAEARRGGVVQSLFPHGRAGFIVAENSERFYFDTRDWSEKRFRPSKGSRVTFRTKRSFDRKHQRPSVVACDIKSDD